MFTECERCCSIEIQAHMDEMHDDITEDYMKLVVNKLCHVKLLPQKYIPMEWDDGTEGDEYKPGASHLLTEAEKVHVACVRTLLNITRQ